MINLVKKKKCDLGFAFDGDGDRLGVVDNKGRIIFADKIVAFLARDVLRITTSNKKAGMLLSNLACLSKYEKPGFNYYSNKLISLGEFIFEKTNISEEAQIEGLSNELWELSKSLINKKY